MVVTCQKCGGLVDTDKFEKCLLCFPNPPPALPATCPQCNGKGSYTISSTSMMYGAGFERITCECKVPTPAGADDQPFSLTFFIRNVLSQGGAIQTDYVNRPYEDYARRLDCAAVERADQLETRLAARPVPPMSDEVRASLARWNEYNRRVDAGESPVVCEHLLEDHDLAYLAEAFADGVVADRSVPSGVWADSEWLLGPLVAGHPGERDRRFENVARYVLSLGRPGPEASQ